MNQTTPSVHNEESKIQAVAVVERLFKSLKGKIIDRCALDMTLDIDPDGNVSTVPTGIVLRVIFR